MIQEEKLLTLEKPNETIAFAVGLDWLKDRFNVLTKDEIEAALVEAKISIEEIYTTASADQPKESGFRFIESVQKTKKPKIIVEPLGQAILLDWDEADDAADRWCRKQHLRFCGLEMSDKDIMLCVKITNYLPEDICKKIKKIFLKYDPEQESFNLSDFELEIWKDTYKDQTIFYMSEKVSQNILFEILKEDQNMTYRKLYALDEYILLTEK